MTYKYTLISLMMTMIVSLVTWTTYSSYHPVMAAAVRTVEFPDAYMEEVTSIIMDKQGKPSMKIITPKLTHFSIHDTTQLQSPRLMLYRKSPKPWYISANHAVATGGLDHVDFKDAVTIHHAADDSNPATLIKTTTLMVNPVKQIAETDAAITLIQPSLVVKATGMYADMNTGNIKLLSQARGEYVPSS